jgi:uncharacterized membrane protein
MKRELVLASGAAELACAGLLAVPRTRRLGGRLSTWLLLSVFPANVQMTMSAYQRSNAPAWYRLATVARLPLQVPMVMWARREANGPQPVDVEAPADGAVELLT